MKLWIFAIAALISSALAAPLAAAKLLARPEPQQAIYFGAPGDASDDVVDVPDSSVVANFDAWEVQQSSKLVAALTRNDDGALFGVMCGKGCSYYMGAGIECTSGHVYTGMLTMSSGAMPLTLRCAHIREEGEQYPILLIDEDLSDALADEGGKISITVPLDNDEVDTSRFSMAGAQDAQDEMLDIVDGQSDAPAITI